MFKRLSFMPFVVFALLACFFVMPLNAFADDVKITQADVDAAGGVLELASTSGGSYVLAEDIEGCLVFKTEYAGLIRFDLNGHSITNKSNDAPLITLDKSENSSTPDYVERCCGIMINNYASDDSSLNQENASYPAITNTSSTPVDFVIHSGMSSAGGKISVSAVSACFEFNGINANLVGGTYSSEGGTIIKGSSEQSSRSVTLSNGSGYDPQFKVGTSSGSMFDLSGKASVYAWQGQFNEFPSGASFPTTSLSSWDFVLYKHADGNYEVLTSSDDKDQIASIKSDPSNYVVIDADQGTSGTSKIKRVYFESKGEAEAFAQAQGISSGSVHLCAKYTVKFDTDDGSEVKSQTVYYGETVSKPDDPTMDGYTFDGWTLDGEDYDFGSLVYSDLTLVAEWTDNSKPIKPSPTPEPTPMAVDISNATVNLNASSFVYDGEEHVPTVESVVLNDAELDADSDYTVSVEAGRDVGTYKVVIEGKGSYIGSVTVEYSIVKRAETADSDTNDDGSSSSDSGGSDAGASDDASDADDSSDSDGGSRTGGDEGSATPQTGDVSMPCASLTVVAGIALLSFLSFRRRAEL